MHLNDLLNSFFIDTEEDRCHGNFKINYSVIKLKLFDNFSNSIEILYLQIYLRFQTFIISDG